MARSQDSQDPDQAGSFAERLKQKYGDGVDPEVSLGGDLTESPSGATSELLKRLAAHGVKTPRYKLEGEVARGGMGAILRVWDEDLRRHLAMKVVLGKSDASESGSTPQLEAKVLARFLEEAQVTGQLDHPGIVPVHELGLDADGRVYFTMKLVKGRDLKAIFDLVLQEKEGWNETRALGVILKVCEAMAYAHKKGVIHRDLKPANIMVGSFGEVFVMDWGLARVIGRTDTHDIRIAPEATQSMSSVKTERREEREVAPDSPLVTMDGDVMGTPAYMSPEQARGEVESLSAQSDVYSVGAMLYHLLARQMPYVPPRARVSSRTVLGMLLQGPPSSLQELRNDVPAELVAICQKAMSRKAEGRYADTLALAEDLRAYLDHRVVGAYETGAVAELKKWVARNRVLALSIATSLFLLLSGLTTVTLVEAANKKRALRDFMISTLRQGEAESTYMHAGNPRLASTWSLAGTALDLLAAELERGKMDPELIDAAAGFMLHAKLTFPDSISVDSPERPFRISFDHLGGLGPSTFVLDNIRVMIDDSLYPVAQRTEAACSYSGKRRPDPALLDRVAMVAGGSIAPPGVGEHSATVLVRASLYLGLPHDDPQILEIYDTWSGGTNSWQELDFRATHPPIWQKDLVLGPHAIQVRDQYSFTAVRDPEVEASVFSYLGIKEIIIAADESGVERMARIGLVLCTPPRGIQPVAVCGTLDLVPCNGQPSISVPFYSGAGRLDNGTFWRTGGEGWYAEYALIDMEPCGELLTWSPPLRLSSTQDPLACPSPEDQLRPNTFEVKSRYLKGEVSRFRSSQCIVTIRSTADSSDWLRANESGDALVWEGVRVLTVPATIIEGDWQIP